MSDLNDSISLKIKQRINVLSQMSLFIKGAFDIVLVVQGALLEKVLETLVYII